MPRNRNRKKRYICLACRIPFMGKANTLCPNCNSKDTERLLGKLDTSIEEPDTEVDATPVSKPETGPKIPTPPPMPPTFTSKPSVPGGGGITAEMLRGVKLKKVVRQGKPLPGPKNSPIPFGVRVVANAVLNPDVNSVRLGRPWPSTGPMYYLPRYLTKSLAGPLRAIASGSVNVDHDNFNTRYRNRGGEMPSRPTPWSRSGVAYYEYGWLTEIPKTNWYKWYNVAGKLAFESVCNRLGGFLSEDGGKVNLERIIIAATGEIFYTPDHYLTFYRYSPKIFEWTRYVSPELRYDDDTSDWDASIYYG